MKLISEYNFREIVGHFVMIQGVEIIPNYNEYLAYCYVDQEKGISFRIFGMYNLEDSKVVIDEVIILRYNDQIQLKIFDNAGESLLKEAEKIDSIYNSDIINTVRNIRKYDFYRDKIFPDDLLLLTFIIKDNNMESEVLWIRPIEMMDDNVYGVTIEDGKYITKGTQVAIIDKELLFKDKDVEVPSVFAIDFSVLENIVKEEDNEI